MRKALRDKWVAALRSGKYEQGRMALCAQETAESLSYCCLGVLLDIGDPKGWTTWDTGYRRRHRLKVRNKQFISDAGLKRFGLTYLQQEKLAALNDGNHAVGSKSFSVIATWIKTHLRLAAAIYGAVLVGGIVFRTASCQDESAADHRCKHAYPV